MNTIWILTKREFRSFFDSLIAYIMLVLFLGISGFFTWLFGSDVFLVGQASLRAFFSIGYWTLFFFIPALTMRLLAEEIRSGTIELLLTRAITDRQVIVGKFLSTFLLIAVALVFTLPYVITIGSIGNLDFGAVICGYLGLHFHEQRLYQHRVVGQQHYQEPDRGLPVVALYRILFPPAVRDALHCHYRVPGTAVQQPEHAHPL